MATFTNGQDNSTYTVIVDFGDGCTKELPCASWDEACEMQANAMKWWPEASVYIQ